MTEFVATRTLEATREKVWQVLTKPSSFEGWLPAKSRAGVIRGPGWTGPTGRSLTDVAGAAWPVPAL
jgi:uncharacterized protein YndB with AHSA1/START domain